MNRALREQTLRACFRIALDKEPPAFLLLPDKITQTPGAIKAFDQVAPREIAQALCSHLTGDWGDLDDEDWATNDRALKDGSRILSQYTLSTGTKFWIITDAGHDTTTFLLPEEY